jgi:hypothetical protein
MLPDAEGPPGQSAVSAFHQRNGAGNGLVGRLPISADVSYASYKDRLAWIRRLNKWRTPLTDPTVNGWSPSHYSVRSDSEDDADAFFRGYYERREGELKAGDVSGRDVFVT